MPWRCPACYTQIQRTVLDGDDRPRQGQHYRCHVCRLELALNERTNALDVAPLEGVDVRPPSRSIALPPDTPKRKRRRKLR
jgi:hypothetical protein